MSTAILEAPVALPTMVRPASPHVSYRDVPHDAVPLRITRRGRLALTATAALVLALVVVMLLGSIGPAGATSSVVVQPGMTLSQIAAEQLPELPVNEAVVDIQRANKLSTTSIAVGQELVIPGR